MKPELLSEEKYLEQHLKDIEEKKPERSKTVVVDADNSTTDNLKYFAFDVKEFPCGIFYPTGSKIQIRSAEVKEIQAYSMVDDGNYYDIVEKMNEMLSSCVRIKYPDGSIGSYMDIRDPDRFYLIFTIRELTFQQGNSLVTKATCSCGIEKQIELKRLNFQNFEIPSNLKSFYDPSRRCFTFETLSNSIFHLAPPTIGLQKAFTEYIVKENSEKRKPNLSFLKIIPFLLYDRTSITQNDINTELVNFQNMNNDDFQFVNSAVNKISFGIEKVVTNCSCGLEVHSDMIFPDGPSAVFVVSGAFDKFIKK